MTTEEHRELIEFDVAVMQYKAFIEVLHKNHPELVHGVESFTIFDREARQIIYTGEVDFQTHGLITKFFVRL